MKLRQVNSVESVAVALLAERLGRLSDLQHAQICAALQVATVRG